MIFELKFSFFGDMNKHFASLIDEILKKENIRYCLFENEDLYLWIDCTQLKNTKLEAIIQELSRKLPQSLFALDVSSRLVDETTLPETINTKPVSTFSYCPTCLESAVNEKCPVCQKITLSVPKIYEIASYLLAGQSLTLQTESGTHTLSRHMDLETEHVYCLDVTKILDICFLSQKELHALVSYEKPILKVKATQDFSTLIKKDEFYLSMAHDLQLLKIFIFLKERGVNFLYATSKSNIFFNLAPIIKPPQTMLILENDRALILKNNTLPQKLYDIFKKHQHQDEAFLFTILEENNIKDQNILHFYFSFDGGDRICFYDAKTQYVHKVMDFKLPKDTNELFEWIAQDGKSGKKLIQNYQATFKDLCQHNHSFETFPRGIMGVLEIAKNILGMSENPFYLARKNLTQRGVAIDYLFSQDTFITQKFNIVKCIRSAMSFKLAGVSEELIALGYIESFSLLPSKLYLALRHSIKINGIALSGDLFTSKMLGDFFYKNNRQTPIYRNILFPLLYP